MRELDAALRIRGFSLRRRARGLGGWRRRRALFDNLGRRLVLAQADIDGVPKSAVAGPLGVRDLGDELRFDPVHVACDSARSRLLDGRRAPLERLQFRVQRLQRALVESSADLARVTQRSLCTVARRDEQSAEGRARATGIREADDDELLPLQALDLEPAAGTLALTVRIARAFRNDAFEAQPARCREELRAALRDVLAIAERRRRVLEQALEQRLALDERRAREIPAVEVQKIECDERDLRAISLQRVLQALEARDALRVVNDGFAVDESRAARQVARRIRDRSKLRRPVVASSCQHRDFAVFDAAQHTITVELRLEDPARAFGRPRHGRRELRRRLFRQRGAPRVWQQARIRRRRRFATGARRSLLALRYGRVVALQQQPIALTGFALGALGHAHERKASLEPVAIELEIELAALETFVDVAERLPASAVPDHDAARSEER